MASPGLLHWVLCVPEWQSHTGPDWTGKQLRRGEEKGKKRQTSTVIVELSKAKNQLNLIVSN